MLIMAQKKVFEWALDIFGPDNMKPKPRTQRFFEEAVELVQAMDMTEAEAHKFVAYVYSRQKGRKLNELVGAHITLLALAESLEVDLGNATYEEIIRLGSPELISRVIASHSRKIAEGMA